MGFKYLEDLGITKTPWNTWGSNNDPREERWEQQRQEFGFDDRETWNLDDTFAIWIYTRLIMFKEKASGIINLDFHKFDFNGKIYTQLEAIDYIIECTKDYITQEPYEDVEEDKRRYANMQNAIRLFAEILSAMWW